ncbi:carbohydrate kinase family protein [Williamsia sterculiae]|uniref:Fructokinase n=1 Tax=Williamsia sterculiae TaxID=1344003 RepID=A0A1N7DEC1_9NOCA|nr:carbohydrate kinase [Williamsia sterculiae]SIR74152.1 fructokinase [Williamsia sterculiae]
MREIVVCGEALVDVVTDPRRAGTPERPGVMAPMHPALGGGPFNVAVALGRLGSAVSFCSRVSTDGLGEQLVAALTAAGVDLTLLQRGPEPTSLALASIGESGAAEYTFYVDGTADRLVTDPGELPRSVAALCFGTLSLVLEPGAGVYEGLMIRAHREGRAVLLDPNIRAAVIGEAGADAYRARFRSWLGSVDVLKVSDDDAEWLAEGPQGSGPRDWLAAGVGVVVITAGGAGLTVLTAHGAVTVTPPTVEVADTIGAGDTVAAALLHWLGDHGALGQAEVRALDEEQWTRALTHAARAAAVTVSRPGADPPWAGELSSD